MATKPRTPFKLFGFEIGKGWIPLVKPTIDKIDELNKSGTQISITQIKSKFGELRVSLENGNGDLYQTIQEACEKSRHICENRGRPAEQSIINGWIYTLCPDCLNTHVKK